MPRTRSPKRWTLLAWTCLFLLAAVPGTAQVAVGRPGQQPPAPTATAPTAAPSSAEAEVRAVNERRFAAMVKEDLEELDRLLADNLTYIHSSGVVETKKQSIASIARKVLRYRKIEPSDVQVRVYGDTAVMTGRVAMSVIAQARELDIKNLFTAVYVRQAGEWRLAAWQSTTEAK